MMLLDSSAWIEFFLNTDRSGKVAEIIRMQEANTSIVTLAEIVNWCHKNGKEELVFEFVNGIKKGSEIIDLSEQIVVDAGKENFERKKINPKWGMMDSIILATARIYGLKIVTKDQDFRDLEDAEII